MKFYKTCLGSTVIFLFVSVFEARASDTWFFDFGPITQTTASNYNNITNPDINTVSSLINSNGQQTTLALSITIPFNTGGTNSNGTTAPAAETGFLPDAARDSFFGNVVAFQGHTVPNSQITLSGLDPTLVYDFTFFASRLGVTDSRQTEYKVTGLNTVTSYLDASNNTTEVATASELHPAADGTIVIDFAPGPDNTNSASFFYLGAMKIVSRGAAPVACNPDDTTPDDKLVKYAYIEGVSPYTLGHWLYRPAGYSYSPCKKYPLLVWLHGLGEICLKPKKGMTPEEIAELPYKSLDLLNRSSTNSPGYQIYSGAAYSNQRPFLNGLILEPQVCGNWTASGLDAMIEYIKTQLRVDEDRIYVTGLSLGGGGTWTYAANKSTKVAAIVPIAGTNASLNAINNASHVPTWAFHNYKDTNVVSTSVGPATGLFRCIDHTPRECTTEHIDWMTPFATTKVMQDYSPDHGATQASTDRTATLGKSLPSDLLPVQWTWINGASPTDFTAKTIMTIFADSGHGGWQTAYSMQEMWQWLYAQKREPAPTVKINSPLIAPTNAGINSGAAVLISAKIALGGVPLAQLTADLKALGGANLTPFIYEAATKTYKLNYTLPTSGLSAGDKGVAIVAVDTNGNRTVKYVIFTLNP